MQIEYVDAADTAAYAALHRQIDAFNDTHTRLGEPDRKLAVLLRDPATGAVRGGLLGVSYYRWLIVDILILPEDLRGAGLGRRIMHAAEREAVRRGCIGVWLVSYSFQAPGFYRHLGYQEFGALDFPNGHRGILLRKTAGLGLGDPGSGLEITETPTEAEEAALAAAIGEYNLPFAGARDPRQFGLVLRDADGAVAGGLWARPEWGLLFIETLILPEKLRRGGLGTRLMRRAEDEAQKRGYAGVFLDTFTFQARPFYERLGYTVFAVIEDYPPGHNRFMLARQLDGDARERR
jgi:GNAT superfamily N-acetyltransferase